MSTTALLLIDIQNDYFPNFPDSKMPLPSMQPATSNSALLLDSFRQNDFPIFHIRHVMGSSDVRFFKPGTTGAEIHESVRPIGTEKIIERTRPNSFFDTELEQHLREQDIKNVTVCGAMSQMCVDASVRAAVDLGFSVTVAHDACAAASVVHEGVQVPAIHVHAAIMAPLAASYATLKTTDMCL